MKPLLATQYLGLSLHTPLIASASPLNARLDHLKRLEDAGAGAVVLPSLFEEQIEAEAEAHDVLMGAYANSSPEAQSYFPPSVSGPYGLGPERYLDHIRKAREALQIPVIASLNGATDAGWVDYATQIEQAGASALELNMYHVPTDLLESGRDVEARYSAIVASVCDTADIPIAIKLTPCLSSIGHFANMLVHSGVAGLVLFNRLMEPDIDLLRLRLTDTVELSTSTELRLPLLWTAILYGRVGTASLATTSGVRTSDDVVKAILAGADAVMTTSAILHDGTVAMTALQDGLRRWMAERDFADLGAMRGLLSWERSRDKSVYTRANYIRILERYSER